MTHTVARVSSAFILKMIRYLEFREEEDVFPTFYRLNTCADLETAAGQAGLYREKLLLAHAHPFFYFVAPLSAAELAASRLLMSLGAERFTAAVILAVLRKPN